MRGGISLHMSDMSNNTKEEKPSEHPNHALLSTANPLPEVKLHHGGSFQKYMDGKIRKLDVQFRQTHTTALEDPELGHLFKGISIHVNGYTQPSHAELKKMMQMYGGMFQNYYSRRSVTHIVCSQLPDAKVKAMAKERDRPPVVRPEWITESIRAKKLLPIGDFLLEMLRPGGPGQTTLQWMRGEKTVPDDSHHSMQERLSRAQEVAKRMRQNCQVLKGPPKSSKDDPNFIESFYQASRLHFIGTWKTRLEKLMLSGIADQSPKPTTDESQRVVIHVDMDCFFASVAEASHPEFKGLPLAVCHSNAKGSGEISSANYEARKYGIHASMFMARAKELCPMLIVVPYEFEKYEVVSETMYRILLKYTSTVQAISCDEAFMDVTGLGDPMDIASRLRSDIQNATSCCASAGIGPNMLLARIATAKAKPNGQFHLTTEHPLQELASLDIQELPGVGWRTGQKLRDAGFKTVGDIQQRSKEELQDLIGNKAGSVTYDYAFGQDDRQVVASLSGLERKSVGAEINWGIRFQSQEDAETFLQSLSHQIFDRLQELKMKGKTLTLKIKKKREGAAEPRKFLGMGICDSLSRSSSVAGRCTVDNIFSTALPLLKSLRLHFTDIRGMGLSMTRLEPLDSSSPTRRHKQNQIQCFVKAREPHIRPQKASYTFDASAIDQNVLSELPVEIQEEIQRDFGLKTREFSKPAPRNTISSKKKSNDTMRNHLPFIEYDPLRMSQIDPSVLHELPVSLQKEIIKSIEPYQGTKEKKRKREEGKLTKLQLNEMVQNREKEARERARVLNSLKATLPDQIQAICSDLHDGNAIGFLSGLETWLSTNSNDPSNHEHASTLLEIACCECRYKASSLSLDRKWTLCRGIKRIFSKFPAICPGYGAAIEQLVDIIDKTHNVRLHY
jgi:DNA repair protein REV1